MYKYTILPVIPHILSLTKKAPYHRGGGREEKLEVHLFNLKDLISNMNLFGANSLQ